MVYFPPLTSKMQNIFLFSSPLRWMKSRQQSDRSQNSYSYHFSINYRIGTIVIAEIGEFNRFGCADKILAYTAMSFRAIKSLLFPHEKARLTLSMLCPLQ